MDKPFWHTVFRDITNATNERTMVGSTLGNSGVGNKAPLCEVSPKVAAAAAMLLSNFDSMVLDWAARSSVGGTNLNYFIVRQLPVFPPETYLKEIHPHQTYAELIAPRMLELTFTAWDLTPFALDLGYGAPPFKWEEERRFQIRCEIDAIFFHLYLGSEKQWTQDGSKELSAYFPAPRDAVEYILESFPIVKRKDEQAHGRYRTKDTILEIYDRMAEVIQANAAAVAAGRQPTARYLSALNPPPGPPADAAGNFIPMAQWTQWPAHIHPPRPRIKTGKQTQADGELMLNVYAALYVAGVPVEVENLRRILVLMLNDELRKSYLNGHTEASGSIPNRVSLPNLRNLLRSNQRSGNILVDGDIDATAQVSPNPLQAPTADALKAIPNIGPRAFAAAEEAMQALKALRSREKVLDDQMTEVNDGVRANAVPRE